MPGETKRIAALSLRGVGKRVLITGAAGMLGSDLVQACRELGLEPVPLARSELDITQTQALDATLAGAKAQVVVNCAAWTDVDGAEGSYAAALGVNGRGAGNVAAAAARYGAWTVHISSDYVFDGSKREPYVESDLTGPLCAYGRSKLEGEEAVARCAPGFHTIVRSSWLFGAGGPCFPATILRLARERDRLRVVEDQVGSPTFTGHLARGLAELCAAEERPVGIVHVAGTGACSWFDFATEIVAGAGLDCQVVPISTVEMPRPATRPAYSVLGTEREHEIPRLPNWQEGLADYLAVGVAS